MDTGISAVREGRCHPPGAARPVLCERARIELLLVSRWRAKRIDEYPLTSPARLQQR
jgi:hypothetical protein